MFEDIGKRKLSTVTHDGVHTKEQLLLAVFKKKNSHVHYLLSFQCQRFSMKITGAHQALPTGMLTKKASISV